MIIRRLRRRLWGVCNTPLPCYRNGIHKIRMYPGRGVLHTPTECFRRKQRGVPIHKNDHSPSPAAFVGRMLLHPYTIGKSEIKKQGRMRYPCMCVLHTPHKYSIKEYSTLHKNDHSPPPAAFVGRMLLRHYRITGMESEK